MKRLLIALLIAAVVALSGAVEPVRSHPHYKSYSNGQFNYRIIVPSDWERVVLNLSKKHIMYVSKSPSVEIKVRAFRGDNVKFDNIVHDERWDLRKIDAHLNSIIETGKITIKKDVRGKLFVFEYGMHRTRMLQRTMITMNADTVYIIECRAPRRSFYAHEKVFNTAMSSFRNIDVAADGSESDADNFEGDSDGARKSKDKKKDAADTLEADDEKI